MMQQPGYSQQFVQGGPPPGYAQQPPANWQTAQNQPAIQAGRSYAANDRLPAMPDMMRRPATSPPAEQRQPVIRGAAPDQAMTPPVPAPSSSSPAWTPIHIPTPGELGIASSETKPTPVATITMPERYDLGTVTNWLDRLGAKSCQREKLAEGVQFACALDTGIPPITVRGTTDEDALQKLVHEVVRQKQQLTHR